MTRLTLGPIMTGKARTFRGDEQSAIVKQPTIGPVKIGPMGFAGDEQADLINHGGADKAIHHYPHDHYAFWTEELGGHELLANPGAFGENITTTGLTEGQLCIGDRFRLGSALVEVSQGRQPCWKIDHKFQRKGITAKFIKTGRTGWYYRVLEDGQVQAGDSLEMTERTHEGWSVERVFRILIGGGHKQEPEALSVLAQLPALADVWKKRAGKLHSAL